MHAICGRAVSRRSHPANMQPAANNANQLKLYLSPSAGGLKKKKKQISISMRVDEGRKGLSILTMKTKARTVVGGEKEKQKSRRGKKGPNYFHDKNQGAYRSGGGEGEKKGTKIPDGTSNTSKEEGSYVQRRYI